MISTTTLSLLTSSVALMGERTAVAAAGSLKLKADFVREMSSETAHLTVSGISSPLGSSTLRKKIMDKATLLPRDGRQLQDNNQNQANANAQIQDGADDYFMAFGSWNNAFGFDPTQYALSYHRCAEVRQFDDELAAQEDSLSVFATKHFAVFRFCPAETCMGIQEDEDEMSWWNRTYGQKQAEEEEEEQEEDDQVEYEYGQEPETVGARGVGCQSNYGEYMIELGDYLDIMTGFREQRFEAYCQYCQDCLYTSYQQWMNSQGRDRELKEFSDESWKDDLEGVDLSEHRALGGCATNSCYKYRNICGGSVDTEFETYFECTEVERKNGMVVYVGPHCAEDGFTIKLGVYGDEDCNEYIGKGVDIQNVLGEKLGDDYLQEYVSGSVDAINQLDKVYPEFGWCIPCKESDQLYPFVYSTDDYSGNEVSELCENLYLASARCDMHYRSWSNRAKKSKELTALMTLQCDFIDSVVMGNYDEMGFVILQQENVTNPSSASGLTGLIAKTMSFSTNPDTASRVTPLQVFGLCASIFACCILGVWAAALHKGKSVAVTGWRPKRARQPAIARQDSGIVKGRSDDSTYCAPK